MPDINVQLGGIFGGIFGGILGVAIISNISNVQCGGICSNKRGFREMG